MNFLIDFIALRSVISLFCKIIYKLESLRVLFFDCKINAFFSKKQHFYDNHIIEKDNLCEIDSYLAYFT